MNASKFLHKTGSHETFLKVAYNSLVKSYGLIKQNGIDFKSYNENKIRDELVKTAKKFKDVNYPFRWITEYPDIEASNRIDHSCPR